MDNPRATKRPPLRTPSSAKASASAAARAEAQLPRPPLARPATAKPSTKRVRDELSDDLDSDSDSNSPTLKRAGAVVRSAQSSAASSSSVADDGPRDLLSLGKPATSLTPKIGGLASQLMRGRATNAGAARVTLGNSADAADARYLRSKMDAIRAMVRDRAEQDNKSFCDSALPEWRDVDGNRTAVHMKNIEDLMASNADFIPYEVFADMQHHENLLATLGDYTAGTEPFVRWSNKEGITFNHVYENIETIIAPVIRETELFALRPEQRLAIGEKLVRYPNEMHASVKKLSEPRREAAQVGLPPMTVPTISLNNYATGNGKTMMAITMAMTEVCDPTLWKGLQDGWRASVWAHATIDHLGLTKSPNLAEGALARVVIAWVPSPLLGQWENTAKAVDEAMRLEKQTGFLIWKGLSVLKRAGNGPDGQKTVRRTMRSAHRTTQREGQPLLWLVPADTKSAFQTVRDAPHLSFPTRIYDECTSTTEPKGPPVPESRALRNIICQATIPRLVAATGSQYNHPLFKALGKQKYSPGSTEHAAIFHLLCAPDWLRLLMCRGMAPTMPTGLRKLHLKIRIQSMSGRLLRSDLTVTGLDDLLRAVLNGVGGQTALTVEEFADTIDRCRRMLGVVAGPSAEAAGMSLHGRLSAAAGGVQVQLDQLPPPPRPVEGIPVSPEAWDRYAPTDRKRKAFTAMKRMFEKLAESVRHDQPPVCPISDEEIPPEHVGIFPCCTNSFDNRYKSYLSNRCPMCGQALSDGLLSASSAIDALVKPPKRRDDAAEALPCIRDDEPALIGAFESLTEDGKSFAGSIKAVVAAIEQFLRYRPTGARILLAFACDGNAGSGTAKTRQTLQAALDGRIQTIDAVTAKNDKQVSAFVTDDDSNRILLINTNDKSLSLEGLDLWNAQLIIMDKISPGELKPAAMVQAIGRIMRPQYELYVPSGSGASGSSADTRMVDLGGLKPAGAKSYPPKWIVLLEAASGAPDPVAGAEDVPRPEPEPEPELEPEPEPEENAGADDGAPPLAPPPPLDNRDDGWEDFDPALLVDVAPDEAARLLAHGAD